MLGRVWRVDAPQVGHVEVIVVTVDERQGELAAVEQVHALRRGIDEVGMAAIEPVGRKELAEQDHHVKSEEERPGGDGNPVPAQPPPHQQQRRRAVEALLRRGHAVDGIRVERRPRHVMRHHHTYPAPARLVGWHGVPGDADFAHCRRPTWRRIRGSSAASARSDRKTPMTVKNAMNIRNEPARNISWLRRASSSIGPVVGSDITMETTAAPEITCGSNEPISETNGLSAKRSGYLNSTLSGGRPLARAVTTYCFCSSSSRLARRRRIMLAVPAVPITMTGIQR